MAKITLVTGSIVGYAYAMEFFIAWYSGNPYEGFAFYATAPSASTAWAYWWVMHDVLQRVTPQFFWFKWCRHNIYVVFAASASS